MKRVDFTKKNLKILFAILAFFSILALSIWFVYFTPKDETNPSEFYTLIKDVILSLIAALLRGVVLFIMYLLRISPEFELSDAFSDEIRINEIREGLHIIIRKLEKEKFKPDIIIPITRSGSIIVNMLAVQKESIAECENLLSLPRKRKENTKGYTTGILPDLNEFNLMPINKKAVFRELKTNFLSSYNKILNYR